MLLPMEKQVQKPRRFIVLRGLTFFLGFFLAVLIGGFFFFVANIPQNRTSPTTKADAIVVLTGGAARIEAALGLLKNDHAGRLLITGVHPQTTKRILADKLSEYDALFECCVDIDHRALNTVGNAIETGRWAREKGVGSLIVVTSSYHMSRALQELARVMPDVVLTSYPVVPENVRIEAWWKHTGTLQLLASEYLKYLASLARQALGR